MCFQCMFILKQFKKDTFYYKLFNDTLTSEDIDNYNAKRKGRGLIDTSNSGKSVLLILNLMHYSYGDLNKVYEMFKMSKLYKSDYDRIKWRAKDLTKLDMIVNYCKSRYRNYIKEESDKQRFKIPLFLVFKMFYFKYLWIVKIEN